MELTLSLACNNTTFHDQSPIQIGDNIGRYIRSKLENTTTPFESDVLKPHHNHPIPTLLLPNQSCITTAIKRKRSEITTESETLDQRSSGCTGTSTDDEAHQENIIINSISCNKKLRLSREQSAFLEDSFKEHSNLNPKQKLALAKQLNLRPRQVEVWFQNRRARTKLKQTEVECDYLKRRCESLSEENKRLQKEVMELRALKAATSIHPFFTNMQHQPPTTLTLCPSCHRTPPAHSSASRAPLSENAS